MFTLLRAGFAAALIALAILPARAADTDKAFQNGGLAAAAIKLEAQIKHDAGTVTKSVPTLRKEADAAFRKRDYRTGMVVLGQMVTVAPDAASNWLRLARAVREIKPRDARERNFLLDRAATAAYIAYQRARDRNVEADSLAVLGRTMADRQHWRNALDTMRLSLDLRETADLRGQYERLRVEHGFRLLNLHRRFRRGVAARLLPVLREPARQAHRFLALRGGGRAGPAGDLHHRPPALRRRPQARRALCHHLARRLALHGARAARQDHRIHHLRARPQAVRALLRQGLCAAAQRPARHPAAQRQYQGGQACDLPHRRPQSHRHRAGLRVPAQLEPNTRPSNWPTAAAARSGAARSR